MFKYKLRRRNLRIRKARKWLRMTGWPSDLGRLRFQSIEVECVSFLEVEALLEELKTIDQEWANSSLPILWSMMLWGLLSF
ncbi:hypothetical protein IC582_003145 [Cucumis melo]